MKNLRLTHILTVMVIILPTAVHGAQICGKISGSVITASDGHGYYCLKGGTHTGILWEGVELNDAFDYVCVNYTADISNSEDLALFHHYISYCSPQTNTYACAKEKRYSSTGCIACDSGYASTTDNHQKTECTATPEPPIVSGPCQITEYMASPTECKACMPGSAGSNGAPGPTHGNIECVYCSEGYYWNETIGSCVICPLGDGEHTVPPRPSSVYKYKRPITECCKSPSTEFTDISGTYSFTDECCYSEL